MDEMVTAVLSSPGLTRLLEELKGDLESSVSLLRKDVSLLQSNHKELLASCSVLQSQSRANRRDLDKGLRTVTSDSEKVAGLEYRVAGISTTFEEIFTELQQKASEKDLRGMERRLDFLCPSSVVERLRVEVESRASHLSVDSLRTDLQQLSQALEQNYCSKDELTEEVQRVWALWTDGARAFAKEEECEKRMVDADIALKLQKKGLMQEVESLSARLNVLSATASQLESELRAKPSAAELQNVQESLGGYCTAADFAALREDMKSLLKECEEELHGFDAVLAEQEKVLARFDEVMLEKASKLDLLEVGNRLKSLETSGHSARISALEGFAKDNTSQLKTLTGKLAAVESSAASALLTAKGVKTDKKEVLGLLGRVADLEEQICMKADTADLLQMMDRKAGIEDIQTTLQSVDILHRLQKMSSVLLNHTLKVLLSKSDSKTLDSGKREWLLKHSDIVVKWATDFNPLQTGNIVPEEMFIPQSPMVARSPTPDPLAQRRGNARPLKLPSIDTTF